MGAIEVFCRREVVRMNSETAFASTEYVEYAVIGAHALVWLSLLFLWLLGIPLTRIGSPTTAIVVLLIPLTLVIGTVIDSLVQRVLTPVRVLVRRIVGGTVFLSDEELAQRAPHLYRAYEWRIRRARIPGAATINWLVLLLVILLTPGSVPSENVLILTLGCVSLAVASGLAWINFLYRAFKFRRNASQLIAP
jgi:hypothetical protein